MQYAPASSYKSKTSSNQSLKFPPAVVPTIPPTTAARMSTTGFVTTVPTAAVARTEAMVPPNVSKP